jgi:hypothetical protein
VDIHRDRVADDDFARLGADERRERVAEPLPHFEPRRVGVGPPRDQQVAPLVDDAVEAREGGVARGAERVAVHI